MSCVARPTAASFRRLSDDEARALSVIRVSSLDDLRSDKMGGTGLCGTCGQNSVCCGGHFGHIDLPIEVPHPLFPSHGIRVLPVPPTRVRLPNMGHDAPLTGLLRRVLCAIQRRARMVSAGAANMTSGDEAVRLAVFRYYMSGARSDEAEGLVRRLRGKTGLLRQSLMGWRVNSCARAVIAPDPLLAPWEVGVPGSIARTLHLKDGDSVLLNRQPSLHRGSIMGHVVRVRELDSCLSVSPTVTPPYNADFDGDEMNLHVCSVESQADARFLVGVENTLLSVANGSAAVRLVQDACLSRYLETGRSAAEQKREIVALCEQRGQAGAARELHHLQLRAHRFMDARGFSVGVDDFAVRVPIGAAGADVYTLGTLASDIESKVPASNRILQMVRAGSKGSVMNLVQLYACVGFQTVCGKPAQAPLFDPDASAFVSSSFCDGLTQSEFWMHASAAREGMIQTAVKTADAGYLMRRMVKCFESVTVAYDGTVRTAAGAVVQFVYNDDGIDPVTSRFQRPRQIDSGEPVGILCAQAIGEKLTQLTLDTFHKAGVAFKHGISRVKALLDACSALSGALLRSVDRPHAMIQYRLQDVLPCWEKVKADALPVVEMQMRGYAVDSSAVPWWRAKPTSMPPGVHLWQLASRVRAQCSCVSDETFVYASRVPDLQRRGGSSWAGSCLVEGGVPLVAMPPLHATWYVSEPPIVAAQLGIEAAREVVQRELRPYMSDVNRAHLALLADAMTYTGRVVGATRKGIRCNEQNSVLGRACFETAPQVLSDAAERGATDPLLSVSSRLSLGCMPRIGSHAFDLHQKRPPVPLPSTSILGMPRTKRARFGSYMR